MFGCAGILGIVAFAIGFVVALIGYGGEPLRALGSGAVIGGMTFVATLLLSARDYYRHLATIDAVRQKLLARDDMDDTTFASAFDGANSTMVLQGREALSRYYEVPAPKIHPTDRFDEKETDFSGVGWYVLEYVLASQRVSLVPKLVNLSELGDVGDVARFVQRLLDEQDN